MTPDTSAQTEADALNRIRLDEDLTYEQLAELIRQSGAGDVDPSVLHRMLNTPDYKPFDRTLHKIRRFLDGRKAEKPARKARTA